MGTLIDNHNLCGDVGQARAFGSYLAKLNCNMGSCFIRLPKEIAVLSFVISSYCYTEQKQSGGSKCRSVVYFF